jgi:prevent-host-death family protein
MKTINARAANQNFSKLLAEVERGETIRITKNGRTVAELRPQTDDVSQDPKWRAAFDRMARAMQAWPRNAKPIGKITEDDKYGDALE